MAVDRINRPRVWLNWWLHVPINARWSFWLILIAQLGILAWLSFPHIALGRAADQGSATAKPVAARTGTPRRPRSAAGVR